MKKILLFGMIPVFAALTLTSCGDAEEVVEIEEIEFKNNDEKLSYAFGVESAHSLFQGDSKFDALDRDLLIKGFNSNLSNDDVSECELTIQKFLGPQGMDFDTTYLKEGSECIGRLNARYFYMEMQQLNMLDQIDLEMVKKGFKHRLRDQDTVNLSSVDRAQILQDFSKKLQDDFMAEIKKTDDLFWKRVLKIPGIKQVGTTGVYVETIKAGTGGSPEEISDIEAHYILTNAKGDTLESSIQRGETLKMNLTNLITGWREGFVALKKGGKYRMFIPYEKAYKDVNPQAPQGALCFYIEFINFGAAGTLAKPTPPMPQQGF